MKDIRQNWKALAALRNIKSEDIAALCIYRAMVREQGSEGAITRLQRSFRAITNPVKLANGARPLASLESALWRIRTSSVYSWQDEDEQQKMWDIARAIKIKGGELL